MRLRSRSVIALLLTLLLAACGGDDGEGNNAGNNGTTPTFVAPTFEIDGQTPTPNDWLLEEDGTLPAPTALGMANINENYDAWVDQQTGWLTSSTVRVPFDGEIDPATATPETLLVYRLTEGGPEAVELASIAHRAGENGSILTATPTAALQPGSSYMALVTTDIQDVDGDAIVAAMAVELAKSDSEITAADIPENAAGDAETYEQLRTALAPLFDAAESDGTPRDDVAAIVGWTTRGHIAAPSVADGQLPMPHDLALDEDGTYPEDASGLDGIAARLENYRGQLHGWPGDSTITLPVEGMTDDGSLNNDTVHIYGQGPGDDALERIDVDSLSVDEETGQIEVTTRRAVQPRTRIVAAITTGTTDADGQPLHASESMFLAMQPDDLVDENGEPQFAALEAAEQAYIDQVQALRDITRPAASDLADAGGPAWNQLAAVWTWSTPIDPVAAYDTNALPSPHDLMLDEDGTFPQAALNFLRADTARGHWERYLDDLHGFAPDTTMTLPVKGRIDVSTVTADALQIWKVDGESWTRIENFSVSEADVDGQQQLEIDFDDPQTRDERFIIFATNEVANADGLPLAADLPLMLAIQPDDFTTDDPALDDLLSSQVQLAATLRPILRPLVETIESETDLTWQDLATVWTWNSWTDTFVLLDPSTGQIPFPNAFLVTDGRIDLPTENSSGLELALFNEVNGRYGFSTLASSWIPLDGGIDESTLDNTSVRVLNAGTYEVSHHAASGHIIIDYTRQLNTETSLAGAVTSDLIGENGHPVQPTPTWVYLESPFELVDEQGASLVPTLDDGTAAQLEAGRQAFSSYFDAVNFVGLTRDDIEMGWAYDTGRTTRPLQNMRAQTVYELAQGGDTLEMRRACEAQSTCGSDPNLLVDPGSLPIPNTPSVSADMSNVAFVQTAAEFDTTMFFDDTQGTLRDLAEDPTQTVPRDPVGVSVYVPKETQTGGTCTAPFDVVVGLHGVTISRNQFGVTMANDLAAYPNCLATVALDMPLHGGRAPGVTDLHVNATPATSGDGFLGLDVAKTKAVMMQAVIDLFVVTRILANDGLETAIDADTGTDYFSTNIATTGRSMGGIMTALYLTVEPDVTVAVLNVAGGDFPAIIEDSILTADLRAALPDPSSFEYLQTMTFVQWAIEHVDPLAFARHMVDPGNTVDTYDFDVSGGQGSYTSAGAGPANQVMMQMVVGDDRVPNRSTEAVADIMGLDLTNTTFAGGAGHNLAWVHDTSDPTFDEGQCARQQIAAWLSSGLSTGTASLPTDLHVSNCTTP